MSNSLSFFSTAEDKLIALNKKIIETKKKIHLSESQRKANFEESEAEKHENAEKIAKLKREIKQLYVEYAKAKNKESALEKKSGIGTRKGRSTEETLRRIEEENESLRKKADLLAYRCDKQRQRLNALTQQREDLLSGKAEKLFKRKTEIPVKKKIESLEVRLERMRMMQMKANIVRRKYASMYLKLKERAVSHALSLKQLERDISEHHNEIKRLQSVKEEATELRLNTQEKLAKQEIEAANRSSELESILQDFRQRVAERKTELERMERMIFQSRMRESYDTTRGRIYGEEEAAETTTEEDVSRLEETFAELRNVTGVSSSEDILNRFLGQQATKENLRTMRKRMEEEKMNYEKKKQQLTAEVETRKFAETKTAEQNAEEMEILQRQIQEKLSRKEKAETAKEQNRKLFRQIVETLRRLYTTMHPTMDYATSDDSAETLDPFELLSLLDEMICKALDSSKESNQYLEVLNNTIIDKLDIMSIDTTISFEGKIAHTENELLFPGFPARNTSAIPASEDEEEVPNRNIVKRQAQALLDMKSRRKAFVFRK